VPGGNDDEQYTEDEESDEEDDNASNVSNDEEDDENNPQDSARGSQEGSNESKSEEESDEESKQSDSDSAPPTPRSVDDDDSLANTIDTPTIADPSTVVDINDPSADPSADPSTDPTASIDESDRPPPPPDPHVILKRPLPATFDPSLRSPIFFGYTLDTLADVNEDAVEASNDKAAMEGETVKKKIEEKREMLQK